MMTRVHADDNYEVKTNMRYTTQKLYRTFPVLHIGCTREGPTNCESAEEKPFKELHTRSSADDVCETQDTRLLSKDEGSSGAEGKTCSSRRGA